MNLVNKRHQNIDDGDNSNLNNLIDLLVAYSLNHELV